MGAVTETVATLIKQLRHERSWSAQRLADECARLGAASLTRGTIAKIEAGVRKSVTADELGTLANALDVPVTMFLAAGSDIPLRRLGQGTWRVRMRSEDGRVHGSGILLPEGRILTCAHVIAGVLGSPVDSDTPQPDGWVTLDFPFSSDEHTYRGQVTGDGWMPAADLAIVAADGDLPPDVQPAQEWAVARSAQVLVLGFPPGHELGVWAGARVLGPGGPRGEWIQLEGLTSSGRALGTGFSGAGVIDEDTGAVVGVIVAGKRSRETPIAWAIPTQTIAQYWPKISGLMDSPSLAVATTGQTDPSVQNQPPSWPHLVGVLPAIDADFQERALSHEVLEELYPVAGMPGHYVLSGMGGVGKTMLAAYVARSLWRDGNVDLLAWVSASSREGIISAYEQAMMDIVGPIVPTLMLFVS